MDTNMTEGAIFLQSIYAKLKQPNIVVQSYGAYLSEIMSSLPDMLTYLNGTYTLQDVEIFCKNTDPGLDTVETAKYGLAITAFIRGTIGEFDFVTLDLEDKKADYLCAGLERGYVFVVGGKADDACTHMRGGTVHFLETGLSRPGLRLEGGKIIADACKDVKNKHSPLYIGYGMCDGTIIVKGDCGCPGWDMRGGGIYVSGNGGDFVGSLSKKGTIVVEKQIKSVGQNCGATLYNQGARVEEVSPEGKIMVRVINNSGCLATYPN